MTKRKRPRRAKNPPGIVPFLVLGAIGVGGVVAWQMLEVEPKKKKTGKPKRRVSDLPSVDPDEPSGEPVTEYGILFDANCDDFRVVEPPDELAAEHPQAKIVLESIQKAATSGHAVDPWALGAEILNALSPANCEFPPSPDAPERIVQLYLWMVIVSGEAVMLTGGKIDGVENLEQLHAKLLEQINHRGYPAFDPQVVPDLIPDKNDEDPSEQMPKLGEQGPLTQTAESGPIAGFQPAVRIDAIAPSAIVADGKRKIASIKGRLPEGTLIELINAEQATKANNISLSTSHAPASLEVSFDIPSPGKYEVYYKDPGMPQWRRSGVILTVQ